MNEIRLLCLLPSSLFFFFLLVKFLYGVHIVTVFATFLATGNALFFIA